MNTLRITATLGPALLAAACTPAAPTSDPETDRLVETLRVEFGLPALAVVVADAEGILRAGASGLGRAGGDQPIDIRSPFHIGSISKPVTSAAVGVLVDQGALQWDTKILDVLPELAAAARPEYASITLRQLLAHTAGIRPFEEDEAFDAAPAMAGSPRAQRLAFARYVLTLEPVAAPGTAHVYSNAGYTVAAAVVEYLLQEDFDAVVRRLVFEPLDLRSAGTGPPSLHDPGAPWGHTPAAGSWRATDPAAGARIRTLILPAGDFHMNLVDLARFGSEQLRGLQGNPGLLDPATAKVIHTEVMDGYGLGWNVRERYDSHLGGLEGMHTAMLLVMKAENRVYAVATNAEIDDTAVFSRLIAELRAGRR